MTFLSHLCPAPRDLLSSRCVSPLQTPHALPNAALTLLSPTYLPVRGCFARGGQHDRKPLRERCSSTISTAAASPISRTIIHQNYRGKGTFGIFSKSTLDLGSRSTRSRGPDVSARCSNEPSPPTDTGDGNSPKRNRPDRNNSQWSWVLPSWLQSFSSHMQLPMRIAINVAMLYTLMRIWPIGGRGGMAAEQPSSHADTVTVNVPFSEFVRSVKRDEVQTVVLDGTQIVFSPRQKTQLEALSRSLAGADSHAQAQPVQVIFNTQRPSDYVMPYDKLESNNVVFSSLDRRGNKLANIMMYVAAAGLILMALNRLPFKLPSTKGPGRRHREAAGGGASSAISFADVAGVDEAKEELQEIVEYLRAPERFQKLGARPPCGVLLVGPPGTGKTMLAKAVAGEAGVPFFSISASEFVELYVGMGAMRVRELFANARKEAPAIVFIDEIDAVAKGRDSRLRSMGNDEREQTLNQLLTELDGFDGRPGVLFLAATNRIDVLDPALLRPGRLSRKVVVPLPDEAGRRDILAVHLRGVPLDDQEDKDDLVASLAKVTSGFSGAELANVINEGTLLAARKSQDYVTFREMLEGVQRTRYGVNGQTASKGSLQQSIDNWLMTMATGSRRTRNAAA